MKKFYLIIIFLGLLVLSACKGEEPTITTEIDTISYTISFETNGGNLLNDISVEEGEVLELTSPEKEGYDFIGWFLDETLTNQYTNTIPDGNLMLYAK